MKNLRRFLLSLILLFFCVHAKGQALHVDTLYEKAYSEILEMLDGKTHISLKRATFLSEQAYLSGVLDYRSDFCQPIEKAAAFLKRFITTNKLEKYKTAKQIALCDYMFRPWSGNNHRPFEYDFTNEYPDNDWHYQLVSRTLKTHKGQCLHFLGQ